MKMTFVIVIVLLVLYIYGIRKENKSRFALHKVVAWVVADDDKQFRCNLSLLHYVHKIQLSLNIDASRRITGDNERSYANEILSSFSENLADKFFCDKIDCENFDKLCKYSRIDGYDIEIHFFMYQLYKFLRLHECDSCFLGNDMHKKVLSYKHHGVWGGDLYDAKYELSDFAVVFHKLRYITYMFCLSSTIFSSEVSSFVSEESFTKVIDSRQIEISRI